MRVLKLLIVLVAVVVVASGCTRVVQVGTAWGPAKAPYLDSQVYPGISNETPTICYTRAGAAIQGGENDHCRLPRGYEDGGGGWPDDSRNWIVDYDGDLFDEGPASYFTAPTNPYAGQHPWNSCIAPNGSDPYGCWITVKDSDVFADNGLNAPGWIFAGCVYSRGDNAYACDYRERYEFLDSHELWDFFRATIDWGKYVKDAGTCAYNLYMRNVTNAMLVACNNALWNGTPDEAGAPLPDGVADDEGLTVYPGRESVTLPGPLSQAADK